jgi:hypothetical protein
MDYGQAAPKLPREIYSQAMPCPRYHLLNAASDSGRLSKENYRARMLKLLTDSLGTPKQNLKLRVARSPRGVQSLGSVILVFKNGQG